MSRSTHPFDCLRTVEPSFRTAGRWRGCFDLDGRRVQCVMDTDEWLRLSLPLPCPVQDWFGYQERVPSPVKVVTGPALVADMAVVEDIATAFVTLRAAVTEGLAVIGSPEDDPGGFDTTDPEAAAGLLATLEESAFTWNRDGGCLVAHRGPTRIAARPLGAAVVFRSDVVAVSVLGEAARRALTSFLLAANRRCRFVRGALTASRIVWEVALPRAALAAAHVDRAVGALGDWVRRTKPACTALMHQQVAERYLEVHGEGEDAHADTDA